VLPLAQLAGMAAKHKQVVVFLVAH
jgi:hypothetical protein